MSSPTVKPDLRVSVVMPAFNAASTIGRAIESILTQTYEDFEFIIVNDGSTDGTADIIRSFSDSRIHFLSHEVNQGLARTLNDGVRAARGQLIARMDADDESLSDRLSIQVGFLAAHPDISCVGSAAVAVFEDGRPSKKLWRPTHPVETEFLSLFETPLLHPTVVGRIEAFQRHPYDSSLPRSEDYDLWSRMLVDGLRLANIRRPLLRHHIHHASFTKKAAGTGTETLVRIALRNMERYHQLSEREIKAVTAYRTGKPLSTRQLGAFFILVGRLLIAYCRKKRNAAIHLPALLHIVCSLMFRVTRRAIQNG